MNLGRVNLAAFIASAVAALSIPLAITGQAANATTAAAQRPAVSATGCSYYTANLGFRYAEADHARGLDWWSQGNGGRVRLEKQSSGSALDCFKPLGGFGNDEIAFELANSDLCLNVAGNSHASGAYLILWPCTFPINELFIPNPSGLGDDSTSLQAAGSKLCIDLSAGINAGSNLVQKTCEPGGVPDPFQTWFIT